MELIEFVDALPLDTFSELRKAVILRHQRHSEEITSAFEYLISQEALIKAVDKNRPACEKVISEKCDIPMELAVKVVDRYLQMREHSRDGRVERPFE
jgi:uncharacterized protein with von Willebrand factor type A (vWA) domain